MQNQLDFLRIRSHKHEIMVSPSEYILGGSVYRLTIQLYSRVAHQYFLLCRCRVYPHRCADAIY